MQMGRPSEWCPGLSAVPAASATVLMLRNPAKLPRATLNMPVAFGVRRSKKIRAEVYRVLGANYADTGEV